MEYNEIKILNNKLEIDRLADIESKNIVDEDTSPVVADGVFKRPMSDKNRPNETNKSNNSNNVTVEDLTQDEANKQNISKHSIIKVD